jgi:glutaredoxin
MNDSHQPFAISHLTLYSKPGCHLCHEMKATVGRVARSATPPVTFEEVDISTDPALESRYGLERRRLIAAALCP